MRALYALKTEFFFFCVIMMMLKERNEKITEVINMKKKSIFKSILSIMLVMMMTFSMVSISTISSSLVVTHLGIGMHGRCIQKDLVQQEV